MTDTEIVELAEKIYDFVDKRRSVTFSEIQNEFDTERTKGTELFPLFTEKDSNIVLWMFARKEINDAIAYLSSNEKLKLCSGGTTPLFCYLVDGEMLNFPIAKKLHTKYKSLRWLPSILNTNKI